MRFLVPLILLAACRREAPPAPLPEPTEPPAPKLRFEDAGDAPITPDAPGPRVSPGWTWGARSGAVRLQRVLGNGQQVGQTTFGAVVGLDNEPLPGRDGQVPWLTEGIDFAGLLELDGQLVLTSHVESRPASVYASSLDLAEDGTLTATSTRPIDLSDVRGGKDFCAGDITPWNTHLASEEYEPDARRVGPDGTFEPPRDRYDAEYNDMIRIFGDDPEARLWPYDYGWIPELTVRGEGADTVVKHASLGRASHELAIVLPDERTVYLSDDAILDGGLFLFVADQPRDLSSGRLYAALWEQEGPRSAAPSARLRWVPLGHAGPEVLAQPMAARRLAFDDLLEAADPDADGTCPEGLTPTTTFTGGECLAVRPGMAALASRFETRRFAALRGATTEFVKGEGLSWDRDGRRVWLAISNVAHRMADDAGDIRMEPNGCGAIVALEGLAQGVLDTDGEPIPSALVATTARTALTGRPDGPSSCAPDAIANPDNVAYLPGHDLLVIAEDTGQHAFPVLWAWDTVSEELTRLAVAPWCGEWTGVHWYPDLGGHGWLSVSLQHAYAYKDCRAPAEVAAPEPGDRTWTGVFGPFPPL